MKIIRKLFNKLGFFTESQFRKQGWKPQPEMINFLAQMEYKKVSPDELEVALQTLKVYEQACDEKVKQLKTNLAIVESINYTSTEDIITANKARETVARMTNQLNLLKSCNAKFTEILTTVKP